MPAPQLLVRLRTTRECSWERQYHRKLKGRFDRALEGLPDDRHDEDVAQYTFSDPMPYRSSFDAGDELHLMLSAPKPPTLRAIATSLHNDPAVTAGSMVMEARAATPIEADVGPPGATGTITTSSGTLVIVEPSWERDDSTHEYWTDRRYDVDTYRDALLASIQSQLTRASSLEPPEDDPFAHYDHRKTYAVEIEVQPGEQLTVIASKWEFGYEVQDDHHRRVLNRLLAGGLGGRRAYGFGMIQTRDATQAVAVGGREGANA